MGCLNQKAKDNKQNPQFKNKGSIKSDKDIIQKQQQQSESQAKSNKNIQYQIANPYITSKDIHLHLPINNKHFISLFMSNNLTQYSQANKLNYLPFLSLTQKIQEIEVIYNSTLTHVKFLQLKLQDLKKAISFYLNLKHNTFIITQKKKIVQELQSKQRIEVFNSLQRKQFTILQYYCKVCKQSKFFQTNYSLIILNIQTCNCGSKLKLIKIRSQQGYTSSRNGKIYNSQTKIDDQKAVYRIMYCLFCNGNEGEGDDKKDLGCGHYYHKKCGVLKQCPICIDRKNE